MKIFFIRLENTVFGGAERYLSRLTEALSTQKIDYEIIHGKAPKMLASWIKALCLNFQVSHIKKDNFYFSLARITCPTLYRAGDGVHRQYMRALNKKWWQNPIHITYCYLEKKCFQNAKLIIANSQKVKQEIIENYAIPSEKIKVIYNGITPFSFSRDTARLKISNEFNIPKERKIILLVGSGFKRKGVDNFLKIVALLKSDVQAIVVGKDKNIDFYREKAAKLGIKNKVVFTGLRSDVNDFYAASDLFLFPALYEPFPNVTLEAMNCNNVVISSKETGVAELLPKELVIQSPTQTAELIDELFTDENKLNRAKQRCHAIALECSMEKNVRETLEAIQLCSSILLPTRIRRLG